MSAVVLLVYSLPGDTRHTLVRDNVRDWLAGYRIPAMWTPRLRGWCIRSERIPDLLALAEHERLVVRLRGELAA